LITAYEPTRKCIRKQETGKFTAPSRFAFQLKGGQYFGKQALSGEVYSKYPVGYPLILAIFILLARGAGLLVGSTAAEVVLCLPSMLAILGSMILLWRAALRLGFGPATANCMVVGLSLGSYLWPYAGINWSEPAQVFCLTASWYCLIAARQDESRWRFYSILGGIALAYGIMIKSTLAVLTPIPVLLAFATWYKQAGAGKALAIDPDYKRCVAAKGMVYLSMRDFSQALTHFQRSLELDPQFELGLYGKGMVMEILGNIREAQAAYQSLLALPPDSLDRSEIRARLARLDGMNHAPKR
jgi:tetratricopeptide (TPR) repeat protein